MDLGHPDVLFPLVIRERDVGVGHEPQGFGFEVDEWFEKIAVTVGDFLAAGGDSFTAFKGGKNLIGGGIDLDALKIYMRANSPVSPPSIERIKILSN